MDKPETPEPEATEPAATEPETPEPETVDPAEPVDPADTVPAADTEDTVNAVEVADVPPAAPRRFSFTKLLVALLLALLGFSLAVQMRSVTADPSLAALGQDDLVRILANLDAHEQRLLEEIDVLEEAKRGLTSQEHSQRQALEEAERRANELGILAGLLPVQGPGLVVTMTGPPEAVNAARLLDAVQELRGAGAEAMQIEGRGGTAARVVAGTYFVDVDGGIEVDGRLLQSPYTLTVIGEPRTLAPALTLPGGVAAAVTQAGGTFDVNDQADPVYVTELVRGAPTLRHARPAS